MMTLPECLARYNQPERFPEEGEPGEVMATAFAALRAAWECKQRAEEELATYETQLPDGFGPYIIGFAANVLRRVLGQEEG